MHFLPPPSFFIFKLGTVLSKLICIFQRVKALLKILRIEVLFKSKSVLSSFCPCVRNMLKTTTFVIGKLKFVLDAFPPHPLDPRCPFDNEISRHLVASQARVCQGQISMRFSSYGPGNYKICGSSWYWTEYCGKEITIKSSLVS